MSSSSTRNSAWLVSFSGIDGAGKSTQINNLCAHFRDAGLQLQLLTFWDDAATLKSLREGAGHRVFGGDKGVGSPEAPIERRDKNVRSPIMTMVRLGMYFLDALSLRRVARRALRSGVDVVVFDRYLYDELANLNLESRAIRFYLRVLARLVPRPDISFVLDADPVQAHKRKPEYPLDFLFENRSAYLRLSELLGMTVIPPTSIEEAKAAVVGHAMRKLRTSDAPAPQQDQPSPRPAVS